MLTGEWETDCWRKQAWVFEIILGATRIPPKELLENPSLIPKEKDAVEEYWRLETSGGRLTTEGWNQSARFFLRPSRHHRRGPAEVIIGDDG